TLLTLSAVGRSNLIACTFCSNHDIPKAIAKLKAIVRIISISMERQIIIAAICPALSSSGFINLLLWLVLFAWLLFAADVVFLHVYVPVPCPGELVVCSERQRRRQRYGWPDQLQTPRLISPYCQWWTPFDQHYALYLVPPPPFLGPRLLKVLFHCEWFESHE